MRSIRTVAIFWLLWIHGITTFFPNLTRNYHGYIFMIAVVMLYVTTLRIDSRKDSN